MKLRPPPSLRYVVWYYHLDELEAWDFLPGRDLVVVARGQGGPADQHPYDFTTGDGDDKEYWTSNSQLQQISNLGEIQQQYISSCEGSPYNYNMLTHECHVDASDPSLPVYTTRYKVKFYPDVKVEEKRSKVKEVEETYNVFVGSEIVKWNRMDNTIDKLYDMFDYAAPKDDDKSGSYTTFNGLWNTEDAACSGGESITGIEWHHISSVTAGTQENILVASRELNTIWSFAHDGSGKKWQFSSSLDSDYSFESDVDMFYQPHSAMQLPNGDIMLIDNGGARPGCTLEKTGGCFSRAIAYELKDSGVARVRWQFEVPYALNDRKEGDWASETQDLWNEIGGSVYKLANGHYLIGFMSVSAQELWDERATCYAFEVDIDGGGVVKTELKIPTPIKNQGQQNGYRFKPWESIDGESATCPL